MAWVSNVIIIKGQHCFLLLPFACTGRQMAEDLQCGKALERWPLTLIWINQPCSLGDVCFQLENLAIGT